MPEPRRPLSPSEDSHSSDKSPSRQSTTMSHSHRLSAPPHMGTVRRPMSPSEASDSQPPTQFSHAGSSKRTSMPSKRHSSSTKEQTDYRPSTSCSHEGPSKKITDLDRSPTYNTYDIHRSPTYISTPGARLSRSPRRMDTALSSPSASSTNAPNPVEQWIRDVPRLGFEENESEKNYNDATTVGSSSSRTNDSFSHTSAPSPVSSQSPSFLYYRLYDEDGLLCCQHPLQNDDSGLGRISVVQIPPPHIVKSIKRALRKAEKIPESCVIALYVDIEGESELDDDIRIPISGSGPGSDPSNALALVISEKVGTRHKVTSLIRGLVKKKSRPQPSTSPSQKHPVTRHLFYKRVKANYRFDGSDANWLPFEKGEVLYTDGEIKLSGPNHERVLLAQNEAGKVGYVYAGDMSIPY